MKTCYLVYNKTNDKYLFPYKYDELIWERDRRWCIIEDKDRAKGMFDYIKNYYICADPSPHPFIHSNHREDTKPHLQLQEVQISDEEYKDIKEELKKGFQFAKKPKLNEKIHWKSKEKDE